MKIEEIITSINNKKIIETNKLKNKKERYEKKEYLVEGIKNVYEYIRYRKTEEIIHVYIKEELYNEYISGKIKSKKEQILYIFEMLEEKGTIIRTAVAVGLDTIYISKNSVDIYSHKVIRASAGMIFKINIIQDDIEKILKTLKNEKFSLVKTVMNGENLYTFAEENVQKKKEKIAIFFRK